MKNLFKVLAWGIAGVLLMLMIVGLCSCNSSKKSSSTNKLDIDSSSKHLAEKSISNATENTNESSNSSSNVTSSFTDGIDKFDFIFDSKTITKKEDSAGINPNFNPIKIGKDSLGNISISTGGRVLKELSVKQQISHANTNLQQVDAAKKSITKQTNEVTTKDSDSTGLKKKIEIKSTTKNTSRFNWWYLLILIPIAFYSYYKFKK